MDIEEQIAKSLKGPEIICLCGSTRFGDAFRDANLRLTLEGKIVLTIGCDMRSDTELFGDLSDSELKDTQTKLEALHFRKIDLAHRILVLNVEGYIGESTRNEIAYAESLGKPIDYLEPLASGE